MTEEILAEIKERADKASSGPWLRKRCYPSGISTNSKKGDIADCWGFREEENAEFIANARQDVPELVAEVESLRELLKTSLEMQVKYAIALSKISCDSQYLNVASSSRGGERLIEIAREALRNGD